MRCLLTGTGCRRPTASRSGGPTPLAGPVTTPGRADPRWHRGRSRTARPDAIGLGGRQRVRPDCARTTARADGRSRLLPALARRPALALGIEGQLRVGVPAGVAVPPAPLLDAVRRGRMRLAWPGARRESRWGAGRMNAAMEANRELLWPLLRRRGEELPTVALCAVAAAAGEQVAEHNEGVLAVLAGGGQVGADREERLGTGLRPPTAGDLLLQLDHPHVALGLVAVSYTHLRAHETRHD